MKFFAKILSFSIVVATLQGAIANKDSARLPGREISPGELYQDLSIENLEAMEFVRPTDPYLKEELLKQYWCLGKRGRALNLSAWIKRYGTEKLQTKWARHEKYMQGNYARIPAALSKCQN